MFPRLSPTLPLGWLLCIVAAPELSQGQEIEPLAISASFLFVQLGIVARDTGAKELRGSLWLWVAQCGHLETCSLRILSPPSLFLLF